MEQIDKLKALFASSIAVVPEDDNKFQVKPVLLTASSFLVGKSLAESSLSSYQCLVVSVLHEDSFLANPTADYIFEEGDTVWIAGDMDKISELIKF